MNSTRFSMTNATQFKIFPACKGERVWRAEVNRGPHWQPSADDCHLGAKTDMPDGMYIVTVNQETPTQWFELAWKATIIAHGQHPEWGFIPMDNYDSAIAVLDGRVVGAAWARISKRCPFYWNVALKDDGEPFDLDEIPHAGAGDDEESPQEDLHDVDEEEQEPRRQPSSTEPGVLVPRTSDKLFVPTIMTIWVHPAHRRKAIGRQFVTALAAHFEMPVEEIGFRLPLWAGSVHMVRAMGLDRIVASL